MVVCMVMCMTVSKSMAVCGCVGVSVKIYSSGFLDPEFLFPEMLLHFHCMWNIFM